MRYFEEIDGKAKAFGAPGAHSGRGFLAFLAFLAIAICIWSLSHAVAAECRGIKGKAHREACYQREQHPSRAPGVSDNKTMMDSVNRLKVENDKLAKRLQGICRGC